MEGRPALGTWQSVVLVDTNRAGQRRTVRLSFLGGRPPSRGLAGLPGGRPGTPEVRRARLRRSLDTDGTPGTAGPSVCGSCPGQGLVAVRRRGRRPREPRAALRSGTGGRPGPRPRPPVRRRPAVGPVCADRPGRAVPSPSPPAGRNPVEASSSLPRPVGGHRPPAQAVGLRRRPVRNPGPGPGSAAVRPEARSGGGT
ncbi:hypothetical protein LO771_18415 [Streptacidiphilus sp. ASG 303]|nr:hypothetical protein [Streptacidiphilus sp. ASG 303]